MPATEDTGGAGLTASGTFAAGALAAWFCAGALMAGADVAMLTSALLAHGPEHLRTVEAELGAWLEDHEYESVAQLRGSVSHATAADPAAYERANYLATLRSWTPSPT